MSSTLLRIHANARYRYGGLLRRKRTAIIATTSSQSGCLGATIGTANSIGGNGVRAGDIGNKRLFSSNYNNRGSMASSFSTTRTGTTSNVKNSSPSYVVYGETGALTVRLIPPSFKQLGKQTIVLDNSKKGRLTLEFTPRKSGDQSGRYAWDRSIKFFLSAEETGMLLAQLPKSEVVELYRSVGRSFGGDAAAAAVSNDSDQYKIMRAQEFPDGSALFLIDYYIDGLGGQDPPTPEEAKGPIEISLMVGEYQVIRSIFQYSIPRLIGWSTMMDTALEYSFNHQSAPVPSPHDYAGRADDLPF